MFAIENGDAILGKEGHWDYYKNYVPSRTEVTQGTKGSIEYANGLREERGLIPLTEDEFDAGYAIEEEVEDE
jgi:hypothetical protein